MAPRAVRLAVDWAFADLGLSELLLEIDPGNLASVRVAQKCGFAPAGRSLNGEQGGPGGGKLVFAVRKGEPRPGAGPG